LSSLPVSGFAPPTVMLMVPVEVWVMASSCPWSEMLPVPMNETVSPPPKNVMASLPVLPASLRTVFVPSASTQKVWWSPVSR